jgi:hypothetical protein
MREAPRHQHRFHHIGIVQSLPPAMLAAALRAAGHGRPVADAAAAGGGGGGGGTPAAAPAAAGRLRALLGAAGSGGSSSSSSRRRSWRAAHTRRLAARRMQQQPQATPPAAAAEQRHGSARHAGIPVFFHRASFNSKFFPDCLAADKFASHYCEVRV